MSEYPKVYTVIVTYNGAEWIDKCINSVLNSTLNTKVIVIDNNSADGTAKIVSSRFPAVELISSAENIGFGRANNLGLQKAVNDAADYVFLLNQDAWVEVNTIEDLISSSKSNRDYGILSPLHKNYRGDGLEYYFSTIISPESCPDLINDISQNNLRSIYEIQFIHAACWLITRNCLHDVGGFDPLFSHYGEDNDYINRTKAKAYKVGLCPNVIVHHLGTNASSLSRDDLRYALNFIIVELKDINTRFRGLLLVYLKNSIDRLSSSLIYRRFSEFRFQLRLLFRSVRLLRAIRISRRESKKVMSFLNA